jgi:hypothetical protein
MSNDLRIEDRRRCCASQGNGVSQLLDGCLARRISIVVAFGNGLSKTQWERCQPSSPSTESFLAPFKEES